MSTIFSAGLYFVIRPRHLPPARAACGTSIPPVPGRPETVADADGVLVEQFGEHPGRRVLILAGSRNEDVDEGWRRGWAPWRVRIVLPRLGSNRVPSTHVIGGAVWTGPVPRWGRPRRCRGARRSR